MKQETILTNIGTQTIDTDRLILRKFEYSDDDSMLKNWVADENVQHLYAEPVYKTKEEVKGLLDRYISGYDTDNYYRWTIIEKASGENIGQIAYYTVNTKHHFAEIEYCIGTQYQCKGYATEATRALIRYGFEKINLHRIQICTRPYNFRSQKVIEKCGFHYEGTLRQARYTNGEYVDQLYYSILRSEFE